VVSDSDTPPPPPADAVLSPSTADFGSVEIGTSSASVVFTLTNTGAATTGELTARIDGADASEFVIDPSSTCGPPLAGGASCWYSVAFHAALPLGAKTATLEVEDGTFSVSATMYGTSVTCATLLVITPPAHDFGSIAVGESSAPVELVVTDPSGRMVPTLSYDIEGADAVDFTIVSSMCGGASLGGGDACNILVVFEPSVTGARHATLRVDDGTACPATAALFGTGI
jgi:hypothetical protein